MFALLFDETTAESFTATQSLNPGFFFKEAVDYAKKRKTCAYDICQVHYYSILFTFDSNITIF